MSKLYNFGYVLNNKTNGDVDNTIFFSLLSTTTDGRSVVRSNEPNYKKPTKEYINKTTITTKNKINIKNKKK